MSRRSIQALVLDKEKKRKNIFYTKFPDFNWKIYLYLNLDLKKVFTTEAQCLTHWEKFGHTEDRIHSVETFYSLYRDFDWKIYLDNNLDLKKIFNTEIQAIIHFCEYGINEDRIYSVKQLEQSLETMDKSVEEYKYFKEIKSLNQYINKYKITQLYISESLKHFERFRSIYSLTEYKSVSEPTIFFGLYSSEDIKKIYNHEGNTFCIFGGTDIDMFQKYVLKLDKFFSKVKRVFSISENISTRLKKINVTHTLVNFSLLDTKLFNKPNSLGNKIYIYNGYTEGNEHLYGKEIYEQVMKKMPEYEYILSNKLRLPYESMSTIYSQCFIGLRLTEKDGNANTVQEFEAMGIPIIHNLSDYGLKWKNEQDVVNLIKSHDINNVITKKVITLDDLFDIKINLEYDMDYNEMLKNETRGHISNELNLINNLKEQNCDVYVNQKLIFKGTKYSDDKPFLLSVVRGETAIKRKNIPRPKYSFCVPYDDDCDGIYCITQSWIDEMKKKECLLYPNVYELEKIEEINSKPIILLEQRIKKEWYNWASDEEVEKLKKQYYPDENAFIICICGRIATNSYPKSLLEAIARLREQGHNINLLVLGKLEVSPHRLTKEEYDEITSYSWVKSFVVPKKEVLNYYRMCDVLASTYRDYCNVIGGSNKIKEFLLCDKPILCSRGLERERELGKDYLGLYECESCYSVEPYCWTINFLNDSSNYKNNYYFNTKVIKLIYKKILIVVNFDWYYYVNYNNELYNIYKYDTVTINKNICIKHYFNIGHLKNYFLSENKISYKVDIDIDNNLKMLKEKKIKIVAVIPVYGREILLKYTIKRLYEKNNLYKVICVGSSDLEEVVLKENGVWVYSKNKPLGEKWNRGFLKAKEYDPDAILFVGSSDWISEDWIPSVYDYLYYYGIVGKNRFDMIDFTNQNIRSCYWLGYNENNIRFNETIGIGRLLSKKFLQKINYQPFDDKMDNSMDWCIYKKCIDNNFLIKIINNKSIFLSLSCDLWVNKHIFSDHYNAATKNYEELKKKYNDRVIEIYVPSHIHTNEEYLEIIEKFPEIIDFYDIYLKFKKV